MLRSLLVILFTLVIGIILYFSWIPDNNLAHTGLLPAWLARWTNRHGNLRTAVPYFLLGFLYEMLMHGKLNTWTKRLAVWAILSILVIITEIVQLYIPGRYPSFADIFWGSTGTIGGMLAGGFLNFVFTPEGE
jgi:VanZ family protein